MGPTFFSLLTTYMNELFYHNYVQQVVQENEHFQDVILHNPHFVKISV